MCDDAPGTTIASFIHGGDRPFHLWRLPEPDYMRPGRDHAILDGHSLIDGKLNRKPLPFEVRTACIFAPFRSGRPLDPGNGVMWSQAYIDGLRLSDGGEYAG